MHCPFRALSYSATEPLGVTKDKKDPGLHNQNPAWDRGKMIGALKAQGIHSPGQRPGYGFDQNFQAL
jgi:hypothetical protein